MLGSLANLGGCWWWLILLGLATGTLGGTFGVGGGILVVPSLVILFAVGQKTAQATSLVVMIPMAFLTLYLYSRNPEIQINFAAAAILAVGAMGGAFVGTQIVAKLHPDHLRRGFAVFVLLVAVCMYFDWPRRIFVSKPVASDVTARAGTLHLSPPESGPVD